MPVHLNENALSEEQVREKFMQFQQLQQKIEQVSEHVEMLNQHNMELEESKNAIAELGASHVGSEVFAPIANGIFIKATLNDSSKLLVNVGSNTVVEKTIEEVIDLLSEQERDLARNMVEAQEFLQQLNQQGMSIYKEVEHYVQRT